MNGIYEFKAEGSANIKDIKLVQVKTNLNQNDYLYDDSKNSIFESNNEREWDSIIEQGANDANNIIG